MSNYKLNFYYDNVQKFLSFESNQIKVVDSGSEAAPLAFQAVNKGQYKNPVKISPVYTKYVDVQNNQIQIITEETNAMVFLFNKTNIVPNAGFSSYLIFGNNLERCLGYSGGNTLDVVSYNDSAMVEFNFEPYS